MTREIELIGAKRAAAELGVHRTTVQRLVLNGHLHPVTKLPGRTGALTFDLEEVRAYGRRADLVAQLAADSGRPIEREEAVHAGAKIISDVPDTPRKSTRRRKTT